MKLFKIQASSIGISRSNDQKVVSHKKSLCKARKKGAADIISKKLDIDFQQVGGILVQPIENSVASNKQLYRNIVGKRQNTLVLYDEPVNHSQEAIVKPNLKLPFINNPTRVNKKQSYKNDVDEIISEGTQNITRENSTQHKNRPSLSKLNQYNQVQGNDTKCEPFLKMMKIQSMKPIQKNHLSKNDLTYSQPDFQREKRAALERIRRKTRNQTEKSVIKHQQDLQIEPIKNRTQTKIVLQKKSQSVEKALCKDRKTTSFIKANPITSKKKIAGTYYDFCLFISLLNKMDRPNEPNGTYKAYVGKGNNSILVKNTLKNRFWWNIIDNDNQVNFFWSQHRQNKFISSIKSYQSENPVVIKKKSQFYLQISKENNQKADIYRNHTKIGLEKLLTQQQVKRFNGNAYSSQIPSGSYRVTENPNKSKMHNHLQFNWHLCNKKALYYNMKSYYKALKQNPFEYIPLTFHIKGEGDEQWQRFQKYFQERQEDKKIDEKGKKKKQKNLWIIKPGENSNQGCGIDVSDDIEEIKAIIKNKTIRPNGKVRSHIIQKYLMPFLYNKRKFDIRCYVLVTSVNSILKAYWYEEGYIRTSSKDFTTKNLKNKFIHLTNDAVQKKAQQYGKFENGNKVSFQDFQKYVDANYPERHLNFFNTVYPRMMRLAADTVKSTQFLLDAKKRQFSFEIFGLDFMIDEDFNTWLIQVNNNPCLELGCPLLARIIPNMIQNAFRIAVDPLFPPPKQFPKTKYLPTELFQFNKFTLIFNSSEQSQSLNSILKAVNLQGIVESDQEQDTFSDANQEICGQI